MNSKKIKLFTNIWINPLAGSTQYLLDFAGYNAKHNLFDIYAFDLIHPLENRRVVLNEKIKNFKLIKKVFLFPNPHEVSALSKGRTSVFRKEYKQVINTYAHQIKTINPDIILINGSHFLAWCLLQAAIQLKRKNIFIHYHGILRKEIYAWENKKEKRGAYTIERDFDRKGVKYIFPSDLAKRVVENEIFCHQIPRDLSIILANPIPEIFFKNANKEIKKRDRKIGIISRWAKLKDNIDFLRLLIRFNQLQLNPFEITIITDKTSRNIKEKYEEFKSVHFKKPMKQNGLVRFYSSQGLIICPSRFETFGNVPVESIAAGVPALISSKIGAANVFKSIGIGKFIINFNSVNTVLHYAKRVINTKISHETRENLKKQCSNDVIFSHYASFLKRIY